MNVREVPDDASLRRALAGRGVTFETRDEVAKALDELTAERVHDYYDEPIPSGTDDVVARGAKGLAESTPGEREQMLYEWFEPLQLGALSTFCIRMCALAVREPSEDLLVTGLTAQALEGFRVDPRDGGYQALGVAYHTAAKVRADPADVFAKAAVFANREAADTMAAYLNRSDLSEILTITRYREAQGPDGFRYEFMGWPPLPKAP